MPDFQPTPDQNSGLSSDQLNQLQPLPQAPAMQQQPGMGTKILGLLSGGSNATNYRIDPNTGKMQTTQTPLSKGDMFKNLLINMMTGLAGGVQANQNGSHGGLAAVAGGFQAAMQQNQERNQMKMQRAQSQFNDEQKAQANKAAFIKAQDEHAINTFNLARSQAQLTEQQAKDTENLQNLVRSTPGAQFKGFYKDFDSAVQQLNDPKERQQMMEWRAKGELVQHPVIETDDRGLPRVAGVEFYHIPTAYLDRPTDQPVKYTQESINPKTGKAQYIEHTIPPGQITNRDAITISQKELKGAITPEDTQKEQTALTEKGMELQMEKYRMNQGWAMMNARFNQEMKMAEAKGEIMSDDDLQATAKVVANYGADLNKFRFLKNQLPRMMSYIKAVNPDWNDLTYESARNQLKDFTSGKSFQAIRASDQSLQHLEKLDNLLSKLPTNTSLKDLNRMIASVARQTGNPEISSAETLVDAISHEYESGLARGVADKASLEKSRENLDVSKPVSALRAAINTMAHVQNQSIGAYAGEYQRAVPGAQHMKFGPNLSQEGEEALHHFGGENPFNFGQGPKPLGDNTSITKAPRYVMDQYMKIAGGDTKKAWSMAQNQGWTN